MKSKEDNEISIKLPPQPTTNIITTTNNSNNNKIINNNNNNIINNIINSHGTGSLNGGDSPSPLTVGGYGSSDIDEESASLRPIMDIRRRSGSGGPRMFKPRGSPRPGGGQRKYAATPPERTPSARSGMSRFEQIRQDSRLKRQNSDPSPGTRRKPKLEIFPPPSPSPNHNSTSDLFMDHLCPSNVDDDLLKVPLRCGASPSVGSFQSDPESCLDGLHFQYSYGEEEDDYDDPFSIGGPIILYIILLFKMLFKINLMNT